MNAITRSVTLDDKYILERGRVYMTGIQALVRLPLDQIRRDRARKLNTAGYISGYRGSPLSGYDQQLLAAKRFLDSHDVVFQPGVNEELAATAVWGTQKVTLHPGATRDGVFGIWYGKAPGVDRCGDVFRHGTGTGSHELGGVLAIAGDDHLAKSSSLPAQSEFAFMDWEMPILSPADIQEVLDYGLHGIALSRYAGCWSALIALAETMDASGVISIDPARLKMLTPADIPDPRTLDRLNRPLVLADRLALERLNRDIRIPAAQAYVRANELDSVRFVAARPRFGIVACGKAYRDLMQTLELLGIDQTSAEAIGLAVYKVAMPWPLEPQRLRSFAEGLDRLLVVENKRALIEPQIKAEFYHWAGDRRPRVWGKQTPDGKPLLPQIRDLGPLEIGPALLAFLPQDALNEEARAAVARVAARVEFAHNNASQGMRSPYFCSGCPHNSSTKAPEGARVAAGIGCHIMTEIAGRSSDGMTQMGGEGVNWLGQFPFTRTQHIFANLGDGTYYHSGILAIRAALAAKAPITYKILYNDAVAMTGGQPVDGQLSVTQLTRQLAAEGVERIVLLSEQPEQYVANAELAPGVPVLHRDEIQRVQEDLQTYPGVSVLIYDQTCAAEKRRRRKKGDYPDPDRRIFINERVCEGCGDCSVQSNCVSVEPLDTAFGQKRRINQSSCNKDFSCTKGFCPSFVSIEGAQLRKADSKLDIAALAADLVAPDIAFRNAPQNILLTGIGGMGVTTAAAVLAMAAHIDGKAVSTLDMTGLAQKGGPVTSQIRLAPLDQPIQGPRVPAGALDVLLAGDMLVADGIEALEMIDIDRTFGVLNSRIAPTAEFARSLTQSFDVIKLRDTLNANLKQRWEVDFAGLAEQLFGDTLFANMMLIGFAWQKGLVPVAAAAIEQAIHLNRVAAETNRLAFLAGRIAAEKPDRLRDETPGEGQPDVDLDTRIDFLARELTAYQNEAYAQTFRSFVATVRQYDLRARGECLTRAVADCLYRLMAYKDEYEVARLYSDPAFKAKLRQQFSGRMKLSVQLAPPLLARFDEALGRPRKMTFGSWIFTVFRMLAGLKGLRGTAFDLFGYTQERRMERELIAQYRSLIESLLPDLSLQSYDAALDIAKSYDQIRGFGPVKAANVAKVGARQAKLMLAWRNAVDGRRGPEKKTLHAAE